MNGSNESFDVRLEKLQITINSYLHNKNQCVLRNQGFRIAKLERWIQQLAQNANIELV